LREFPRALHVPSCTGCTCGGANGILAYIYYYGFKRLPLILLAVYLLIIVAQGFHRFRVVVPVLMLAQIYLDRRRLPWPPGWMLAGLLILGVLFFPLKVIGRMLQEGASFESMGAVVTETTERVMEGQSGDQMFLDQLASGLTLIDINRKLYWGTPYLVLITLPIPRQWWPGKPGMDVYMEEISIPSRPMKEMGMTATLIGEAYANFGVLGVILVPPILAAVLLSMYRRAYRAGYYTVPRLAYVLVSVNLIRVYRDGLVSLVVFAFVNAMPLTVIVLLHFLPGSTATLQPELGPCARR
jgi:hypothetical protein